MYHAQLVTRRELEEIRMSPLARRKAVYGE